MLLPSTDFDYPAVSACYSTASGLATFVKIASLSLYLIDCREDIGTTQFVGKDLIDQVDSDNDPLLSKA